MEIESIRIRTHAKLNLYLRVVGARPDGYHEIETILHGIELGDDIEVTLNDSGRVTVDLEMAEARLGEPPIAEQNTVFHVAQRLIERGADQEGLAIKMIKHIPVGAGLGGGSGNAAGVLVALNELWAMELGRPEMLELAGGVGSDVPYCLDGGTALATARGEQLTPLPAPDRIFFVLGLSSEGLLTKDVYDALDAMEMPQETSASSMTLALGSGDLGEIGACLHNDLEAPAFAMRPELAAKKQSLVTAGALGAGMSGSGPSMFGIAKDEEHARGIAAAVEDQFDTVLVTSTRSACIERLD